MVAGGAVVAGIGATALVTGRRLWFFSDDWNIYAEWHTGNLLEPFNGHLSLVPAGIYQLLFHTVGVDSYLPYRLCGLAAYAVLGFQVLRWAGARVGPFLAVAATAAVLWNSFGTTNVMFPFLMNFSLPMAALVACWWHIERGCDAGPAGDGAPLEGAARARAAPAARHLVALGLWLALALATSGLGLLALVAVVVDLVVRRAPRPWWLAVAAPSALWLAWFVAHREANDIATDVPRVGAYAARMLWAGFTALAAGWKPGGLLLAAAFAGLLVLAATRWHSLDGRALGAIAAALAFAGLTSLTRQGTVPPIAPDELRYGWTIGACIVLAAAAAWRPPRALHRGVAPVAALAVVAVLAAGGVHLVRGMNDWADLVSGAAPGLRSTLYAAEAAGAERLEPDEVLRPLSFVPVRAGDYLDAVADVGSPLEGAGAGQIGGRPDQGDFADDLFFAAVGPLGTGSPGAGPGVAGACTTTRSASPGDALGALPGSAGGAVEVRRFGSRPAERIAVDRPLVLGPLPEDAPVGTDARIAYRLAGTDGVVLCGPGG
jgi:hypothetical protein